MRLKALSRGIDLAALSPYEERDLLVYMLGEHYASFKMNILQMSLTRETADRVVTELEEVLIPWVVKDRREKRDKDNVAMKSMFDEFDFIFDRDIRTDEVFVRMVDK